MLDLIAFGFSAMSFAHDILQIKSPLIEWHQLLSGSRFLYNGRVGTGSGERCGHRLCYAASRGACWSRHKLRARQAAKQIGLLVHSRYNATCPWGIRRTRGSTSPVLSSR
jgi:hypothetical protein